MIGLMPNQVRDSISAVFLALRERGFDLRKSMGKAIRRNQEPRIQVSRPTAIFVGQTNLTDQAEIPAASIFYPGKTMGGHVLNVNRFGQRYLLDFFPGQRNDTHRKPPHAIRQRGLAYLHWFLCQVTNACSSLPGPFKQGRFSQAFGHHLS